jgi:hypothetical protein
VGQTILAAGHISHGRSRHLLNGFSSRGIAAMTSLAEFADVSVSILNGTSIVGWDNLSGLANPSHQLVSGTFGLEFLPQNPGTVRVEGSYVYGMQLPLNGTNQALVNDAEESKGGGVRVLLSDLGKSLTVDAGFTVAQFLNPSDPLLDQGLDVVPVESETRQARYADVMWDVVRNATILGLLPARLHVGYRHERVDPLYRVVGASVRADNLQNSYDLHGAIGPLQCDLTHVRSEDNLAEIASVLKSRTRQSSVNAMLSPVAMTGSVPQWLPTLLYSMVSTHQYGVSTPANSDFTPDRVPDQLTLSQTAGIEWQTEGLRLGYRGAFTVQDNRQEGLQNNDVASRTHGVNVGLPPLGDITTTLDGSLESIENTETGLILRSRRIAASVYIPCGAGLTASLNGSHSISQTGDGSSEQDQSSCALEVSYLFDLSPSFIFGWKGQMFVRYSWNEFNSSNSVFDLDAKTRSWAVNTGISINLF